MATNVLCGFGEDLDDTELIKSYENAVKSWNKPSPSQNENATEQAGPVIGPWVSVSVTSPNGGMPQSIDLSKQEQNLLSVGNWIIGSPCRAVWSEDGLEYEAKIVGMEGPSCTIRFVGGLSYGNEEKKELTELRDTFGKRSRDRQRREAQQSNMTNGELDVDKEYYSSVSLTSSMYNNCNDSVLCKETEDDKMTTTTECSGHPRSSKFSKSALPKAHQKNNLRSGENKKKRRGGEISATTTDDAMALDVDVGGTSHGDPLDRAEEIVPSAEATIFSSSDSSSVGEDSDDEAEEGEPTGSVPLGPNVGGGVGGSHLYEAAMKTFPNSILRLPIPPMPMSLAGPDGKVDYGRGQIPALLLSWYMSGYHAGYFDAQNELSSPTKNGSAASPASRQTKEDKTSSRNHQRPQ